MRQWLLEPDNIYIPLMNINAMVRPWKLVATIYIFCQAQKTIVFMLKHNIIIEYHEIFKQYFPS